MCSRVLKYCVLFAQILTLSCVTVTEYHGPDILSKSKTELKSLLISARIGDIIIISAPIVNSNTKYYLTKPNSDTLKLNLNVSRTAFTKQRGNDEYNDIVISLRQGRVKSVITPVNNYEVFNLNYGKNCYDTNDIFKEHENGMMPNDYMIGPLIEEDHGNWILSAYYEEKDGEWIEVYQVISVEIIESMQIFPTKSKFDLGSDLELRFAYPINNLESCQITAPKSTFDRFYDRDHRYTDTCGFKMPNVTRQDEGMWRIIGVGRIVYEANVYVEINNSS